jgi:hypothetical protein
LSRKKRGGTKTGLRLAPGVHFAGKHAEMPVLVGRDGRVQLNSVAATILRLCDGSRTRGELVDEVTRQTHAPARAAEIVEFLDAARARGWIDGE